MTYPRVPIILGKWTVLPQSNGLRSDDAEMKIEPLIMNLLMYFASRAGEMVTHQELIDEVWKKTIVCDQPVYQAVAVLRRLLGDDCHHPIYIETVSKRGYRLIAPVSIAKV